MYVSCFYALAGAVTCLRLASRRGGETQSPQDGGGSPRKHGKLDNSPSEYAAFRRSFLVVALLALFSDWLQGPYVYQLYSDYGFSQKDIAQLFVMGFLSSMIAGTIAGAMADKYGRRRMCWVFAITYIISCLTKIFPIYGILMIGRLTGGVATSLLFSVFESWVVCEHSRRGYPSHLLSQTLGYLTFGNGIVAVLAGLVANYAADSYGTALAPFIVALVPLSLVLVMSFGWSENYGDVHSSLAGSLSHGWGCIRNDQKILSLGLAQGLFEAAMYCFVFFWSPALIAADQAGDPGDHLGIIFSSFMVCVTLGSMVFEALSAKYHFCDVPIAVHAVACISSAMSAAFVSTSGNGTFFSFLVFETSVGMFYPAYGVIKSRFIEEDVRSTVMNFFRVPLNAFVALLLLNIDQFSTYGVLVFIACMHVASLVMYLRFRLLQQRESTGATAFELVSQDEETNKI